MGQVVGFLADLLVELGQVFDLFFEREPLLRLLVVSVFNLFFKLPDLFAQGLKDLIQLRPVLLCEFFSFLL